MGSPIQELIRNLRGSSAGLKDAAFMIRAADCATGMILDDKPSLVDAVAKEIDDAIAYLVMFSGGEPAPDEPGDEGGGPTC